MCQGRSTVAQQGKRFQPRRMDENLLLKICGSTAGLALNYVIERDWKFQCQIMASFFSFLETTNYILPTFQLCHAIF